MGIGLAPVREDTASAPGLLFKREAYESVRLYIYERSS